MRQHQTDEADRARRGHHRRRHQRGEYQQHRTGALHRHPEGRRGVLTERERVHRRRHQQATHQPEAHHRGTQPHIGPRRPRQRPKQPEQHTAGLLGIGRRQHHKRCQRREQLRACHSREHHAIGAAAGEVRQGQHQREGHHGADERATGQRQRAAPDPEHRDKHCPGRRSRGHPEHKRIGQRVAQQRLQDRTAERQPGTTQRRQQCAR